MTKELRIYFDVATRLKYIIIVDGKEVTNQPYKPIKTKKQKENGQTEK